MTCVFRCSAYQCGFTRFFWLAGLILGPRTGGPPVILAWVLAFFLGILCHELGHALLMRRRGDLPWITLYGFGGLASSNRVQNMNRGNSDAWQDIFISLAGPLAGFLLAAIVAIGVRLAGYSLLFVVGAPCGLMVYAYDMLHVTPHTQLLGFVNHLFFVTIAYGILNLLPVYPLDGGQIARELFIMVLGRDGIRQSLILSMFVACTLALAGGLLWHDMFFAVFFGYFAYASFATLQIYGGRNPW